MTSERQLLDRQLESAVNRYAIVTGALELFFLIVESPRAQVALGNALSGVTDTPEWREFGRFVGSGENAETWWGPVPIDDLRPHKDTLIHDLVGKTLTEMIGAVDYYLSALLKSRFGRSDLSGSAWAAFERASGLQLLQLPNGEFVYRAIQERHKVEHNRSVIDERFLNALDKKGVSHSYVRGSQVERGHFDVMSSYKAFRQFADRIDEELAGAAEKKRV